jgi:hypothetical protein
MTGPGYAVLPAALAETAAGIEAVIDELRPLAPFGAAETGRGVAQLGSLPGDVGHAGLSSAFLVFCDRWEWGVRDAVHLGVDLADDLRAAGTVYGHADGAGHNLLARIAFDVVGDPGGFGDTWDDVGASIVLDRRMPNWGELGGQWADTAGDVALRSWPGTIARALRGNDPYTGQVDDLRPVVE